MVSPSQKILSDCGERENGIVSEDLPKTDITNREAAVAAVHREIQYYEGGDAALVYFAAVSAGLMPPMSWEQFDRMFPGRCKKGTFYNAHKRETWTPLIEAFVEGYRQRFHLLRTGF